MVCVLSNEKQEKTDFLKQLESFFVKKGTLEYIKNELQQISKEVRDLELDWKMGEISSSKFEKRLLELNEKYDRLKDKENEVLKSLDNNGILDSLLTTLDSESEKLKKLDSLKEKKKITKKVYAEYQKKIESKIKDVKKTLKESLKHLKTLKKTFSKLIKMLNEEKNKLYVRFVINNLSEDEYKRDEDEVSMKIFIYKIVIDLIDNYVSIIKKRLKK